MADFVDKGKVIVYNACQATKLHARILAKEARLQELYYKLGREYYYDLENDVDDISGLEELCDDIKQTMNAINIMKRKLSKNEHLKVCRFCGGVNTDDNFYCGKCGNLI